MRTPLIVANWKMNKTISGSSALIGDLLTHLADHSSVEVAVAPPFTSMETVSRLIEGTRVQLAAQNMYWEREGAFTGEISPGMLAEMNCRFVILGHSERRQYFGDGDGEVARKIDAALEESLVPILCVGETLGEREYGKTFEVVESQIAGALLNASFGSGSELVVAYEPVWAIGTGRTSSPEVAQEAHEHIRGVLCSICGDDQGGRTRILYGGSVKPDNVDDLMAMSDIDGALVGGASLDGESFARIVDFK